MRTQFLAVAGGQIAYDDSQTGRALVVLVPGFGDTRRSYRFLRPRVAGAGYRVVTMDLRGHGETTVPWRDYTQTAGGAKDPAFPDPAAEATAQARLLNCPAHLIDGAGHYPQSEFPDHTAEILLPFISQALGGPVPQGT